MAIFLLYEQYKCQAWHPFIKGRPNLNLQPKHTKKEVKWTEAIIKVSKSLYSQ